jgi:hypothetical protein
MTARFLYNISGRLSRESADDGRHKDRKMESTGTIPFKAGGI